MPWHSCIGLFLKFSMISKMIREAAGFLLGLVVLGLVIERAQPPDNEVVIHVKEPDVVVTLGDLRFEIQQQLDRPIVCELRVGWYQLMMRRGEQVLYEESFEVRPNANIVLCAWDRANARTRSGTPAFKAPFRSLPRKKDPARKRLTDGDSAQSRRQRS